jgi:MFS family permease
VVASLLFLVTTIDRSFSPVIPLFVAGYTADSLKAARLSGIILSLAAFAESFAAWYSGKKMTRSNPKQFLLVRLAVGSVICILIGFAASIMQLLGLRVLLALLAGGTLTVAYTLASRVIPEGRRAAAFGLLSSFAMMGGAVGPLLGGLSVLIDIRTVFFFNGLIYAGLSWAVWRSLRGENQKQSTIGLTTGASEVIDKDCVTPLPMSTRPGACSASIGARADPTGWTSQLESVVAPPVNLQAPSECLNLYLAVRAAI